MLNMYVHKTSGVLYNTVTKKSLSLDASHEELEKNFFLEGQEKEAVHNFLSKPTDVMAFIINNTWECNLRCTHCSVRSQLVSKQSKKFDYEKFLKFANAYIKQYDKKTIGVSFLGGEAFLEPKSITEICKVMQGRKATTTNLAFELTDEVLEALSYMDLITVSIDGLEKEHNAQRIPFRGAKINPFEITVNNLKTLIKKGMRDKVGIQGSLKDELINDDSYIEEYFRFFLKMGFDNISYGCLHTTDKLKVPTELYIKSLKHPSMFEKQCCVFRPGDLFYFDADGNIWNSYWSWARSLLGTIDDEPTAIVERHVEVIKKTMPSMQDQNCQKCPALGVCWGRCVNGVSLHGNEPSKYCDQEGLIRVLRERAEKNILIKGA